MDKASTRKMLSRERHQFIMNYLKIHKSADVSFLSNELQVSKVTIRKDLEKLESDNALLRSHGGAVLNEHLFLEPSFIEKEDQFAAQKSAIAEEAAKLVQDGMSVALTTGTTVNRLANKLQQRSRLRVVTNAVNVATGLMGAEGVTVFLTGGIVRPSTFAVVGETAENALDGIFVECAFIGVNGFSMTHGLTTPSMEEARVVRKVIENAKRVIVLLDHSKFNKAAFYRIALLDQVHTVITDSGAPQEDIAKLTERGIEVITAGGSEAAEAE